MSINWNPAVSPSGIKYNIGDTSWQNVIFNYLAPLESATLTQLLNVTSVQGNPTIGVGFDLYAGGSRVVNAVLIGLGFDPAMVAATAAPPSNSTDPYAAEELQEYYFITRMRAAIAQKNISQMQAIMAERSVLYNSNDLFADYLSDVVQSVEQRPTFAFLTPAEVYAVFNTLLPLYQNKIYGQYGFLEGQSGFLGSREDEALLDMAWNSPSLLGSGLGAALNSQTNQNRALAWFEIRYGSNKGWQTANLSDKKDVHGGLAARRYFTSQVFGLYNNPLQATLSEAIDAYQMLTLHRSDIFAYETKFGADPNGSSPEIAVGYLQKGQMKASPSFPVQTLAQIFDISFQQISQQILNLVSGIIPTIELDTSGGADNSTSPFIVRSTDILIAPAFSSSVNLTGDVSGAHNHIIIGAPYDGDGETLKGGIGNDIIIGGAGYETIYAGQGLDTIIGGDALGANFGDGGNDTIYAGGASDTFDLALPSSGSVVEAINPYAENFVGTLEYSIAGAVTSLSGSFVPVSGQSNEWANNQQGTGVTYQLTSTDQLIISNGALNGSEIIINNFNIQAAESNTGFYGIFLQRNAVGSITGTSQQPATTSTQISRQLKITPQDGNSSNQNTFYGGTGVSFTFSVDSAYSTSQPVNVTLSGANSADFGVVIGDSAVSLTSTGSFELNLPAGQTQIEFELVDLSNQNGLSDIDNGAQLQLVFGIANPDSQSAESTLTDVVNLSYVPENPDSERPASVYSALASTSIDGLNIFTGDGLNDLAVGTGESDIFNLHDSGSDSIVGGSGVNTITGGVGADIYKLTGTNDLIYLGAGYSTLSGSANGDDTVYGNHGDAIISGNGGTDLIFAGNGENEVYAGSKTNLAAAINAATTGTASGLQGDLISVLDGDDTVVGGTGNDLITAGTGNDMIVLGPGNDTFVGGYEVTDAESNWSVSLSGALNNTFNLNNVTDTTTPFVSTAVQPYNGNTNEATGSPVGVGNDTIFTGNGNDYLSLGNGDNSVALGSGTDTVYGGMGDDTIVAGSGNDFIRGGGDDTYLEGGSGTDTLQGGDGDNVIIAGSGSTTIISAEGPTASYAGDTLSNNYVEGGSGDDVIYGSAGADTLIAGTGSTTINGGTGTEFMEGGSGSDVLIGGSGNTTMSAGSGSTTLQGGTGTSSTYLLQGGDGTDYIVGGSGTDQLYAGNGGVDGSPTEVFASTDPSAQTTIYGGGGVDLLEGGAGATVIYMGEGGTANAPATAIASSGSATIYGGAGTDLIEGGSGQDVLYAGDGGTSSAPTTLLGGTGASSLYGGSGPSIISDTESGQDVLTAGTSDDSLIGIGADTLVAGEGNDVLQNNGGTLTAEFTVDMDASELLFSGAGQDNLYFDSGVEYNEVSASATIDQNGNPLLELSDGGSTIEMVGGLTGTLGQVTFADGNSDTSTSASTSAMPFMAAEADIALTAAFMQQAFGSDTVVAADSYTNGKTVTVGVTDAETLSAGSIYGVDTISSWGDNSTISGSTTNWGDFIYAAGVDDSITGSLQASDTVRAAGDSATVKAGLSDSITLLGSDDLAQAGTGSDTLTASGLSDTLISGSGNATFCVNDPSATVVAPNGSGVDTIISSVNFTAPTGVNVLTLTGSANLSATGNSANDTLIAGAGNDTLNAGAGSTGGTFVAGSGGTVFVINSSNDVVQDSIGAAATVLSSASFALPTNVNELILTGSAALNGTANAGADTLIANSGIDTLVGGTGNDVFVIGNASDVVQDSSSATIDTVESAFNFTLVNNVNALVLTGASSLRGVANNGTDTLTSNSGVDTLVGGTGNDTFVVNNAADVVQDASTTTSNTMLSSVNVTLPGNVNTLFLTGAANLAATGNGGADLIIANSGNDTLTATGASTTLTGGFGNDLFIVNSNSDVVTNPGAQGNDTLQSSMSVLAPINVNTIVLTGSANLTATANGGNDTLVSNSGVDTLYGGPGNDVFIVNNAADVLVNVTANDTVLSSVGVTVPAGTTVMPLSGAVNLRATTNSGNDEIIGNAGNDTLVATTGQDTLVAGVGLDTLVAGSGADDFVVNNSADVVSLSGAHGVDTISSSATFTLPANINDLVLTGSGNLQGTAVSGNNLITGNAGADELVAGSGLDTLVAGTGVDTLVGGTNADVFVIDNTADVIQGISTVAGNIVESFVNYTVQTHVGEVVLEGSANVSVTGGATASMMFGNGGVDTMTAGTGITSMFGGTGADLFVVNNSQDVVADSSLKNFTDTVESSANFSLSTNVGELVLTGSASLTGLAGNGTSSVVVGNAGTDTLEGGLGDDTLVAGSGADSMIAGAGETTFVVNSANDTVVAATAGRQNEVQSSVSFALPTNVNTLVLTGVASLTGTANGANDLLTGGGGADTLTAGAGADTLVGGSAADTLVGGTGATTFVVDNTGDVILNAAASVANVLLTSVSDTLPTNVNAATVTSSANIAVTGNAANDTLTGGTGLDTLVAGTGSTTGTFIAGSGGTTFVVNNSNDVVQDAIGAAATVQSSANFALPTNVGELILTGSTGLKGTANAGADTLVSNSGIDTLVGGTGNDVFVVGNTNDVVQNTSTTNSDTVDSSVNFTLANNVNTLVLSGAASLRGAANNGADTLVSNAGVDTLVGGTGNDTFVVNNAADVVQDTSTTASNTMLSSVNVVLPTHVNTLTLTGSSALSASGNGSADLITANAGNDTLTAAGVSTTLVGGPGNDLFVIGSASDVVECASTTSNDTLESSVNIAAPSNVNTLVATGSANLAVTANGGNDTLVSNSGVDTLYGGSGNDVFVVNNSADVLVGVTFGDTILSSVTYSMPSGVDAMMLTLQSSVAGTGNIARQTLTAEGSNDTLVAGEPSDTLIGGTANTTYVINDPTDVIVQANGNAGDTLLSSTSYILPANVDTLLLTGTSNLSAIGNSDATNVITANAGNDSLVGVSYQTTLNGGSGSDTLMAGSGANLIYAGNGGTTSSPTIVQANTTDSSEAESTIYGGSGVDLLYGGGGQDLIYAGSGPTSVISGSGADSVYGNAGSYLSDSLSGSDVFNAGSGSETLAGFGTDTLIGGSGTALMTNNAPSYGDGVFEFNVGFGQDTIGTDAASSSGTLDFGAGIDPGNLTVSVAKLNSNGTDNGLSLVINDGASSLVIRNGLAPGVVTGVQFTDNSVSETFDQFMNASGVGKETVFASGYSQFVSTGNGQTFADLSGLVPTWAFGNGDNINALADFDTVYGFGANDTLSAVAAWAGASGDLVQAASNGSVTLAGAMDTLIAGQTDVGVVVSQASDVVQAPAGATGIAIYSFDDYTLPANVQSLTLEASVQGLTGTSNAVGGVLTAGAAFDTLDGGSGSDTLVAGASDDVLVGGSGAETYVLHDATDSIVFGTGNASLNAVQTAQSYTLPGTADTLVLVGNFVTGTANSQNDLLQGTGIDDTLVGGAGADTLVGDSTYVPVLIGGTGNDVFEVNSSNTVVDNTDAAANDSLLSSVNFVLPTNVNTLVLAGASALTGQGNSAADVLQANAGADTLTAGSGNDTLIGGAGGDTFVFDSGFKQDLVQGLSNGDLIDFGPGITQASLTFTALAGAVGSAPSLVIAGDGGAVTLQGGLIPGAVSGVSFNGGTPVSVGQLVAPSGRTTVAGAHGNLIVSTVNGDSIVGGSGNDTIVAWASADTLAAGTGGSVIDAAGASSVLRGGAATDTLDALGASDTLIAGTGHDALLVNSPNDVVQATASNAQDTVFSSVSYAVPTNLTALSLTGSGNLQATANGGADILQGNAGTDTLYAGAGVDTLVGGTGNDVFVINSASDVVVNNQAATSDTIVSPISETLPAGVNTLCLTGTSGLSATGNSASDYLQAAAGGRVTDTLVSGSGVDTLDGNGGSYETFVINNSADSLVNTNYYDTVDSSVSYVAQGSISGDVMILTGSSNLSLQEIGSIASNTLVGNAGNDVLTGGVLSTLHSGSGVDTLVGTAAGTTFVISNPADVVLDSGFTSDTIESSLSGLDYNLSSPGAYLWLYGDNDSATLSGAAAGGIQTVFLSGSQSSAVGGAGNNWLEGGGQDTLIAGSGTNTFSLSNGDTAVLNAGTGVDVVGTSPFTSYCFLQFASGISPSSLTASVVQDVNGNAGLELSGASLSLGVNGGFSSPLTYTYDIGTSQLTLAQLLQQVQVSNSSVSLAGGNFILNGTSATSIVGGTGNDTLYAAGANVSLVGGSGNQFLEGSGSHDYLLGGTGLDSLEAYGSGDTLVAGSAVDTLSGSASAGINFLVNNASDVVIGSYSTSGANDTITSSSNYALPAGGPESGVNILVLSGTTALTATANASADTIVSNSGVDTLDANSGGSGVFVINNPSDSIQATSGASVVVDANVNYVLPAYVDTLTITGSGAIKTTGNGDADTLEAGSGADTLVSGSGTDSLVSGSSADVFVINKSTDTVSAGKSSDTVQSAVSYTLPTNVGTLELTGSTAMSVTGGSTAGTVVGNSGADTLTAGSALTTLVGGSGSDLFVVNNSSDVVRLGSTWGVDTVRSSANFVLPGNSVDNLVLTGTAALSGTGNAQADVITANSGNDTLVAGTGVATLNGGTGNDLFVVNSASDAVKVGSTHGVDTMQSSVSDTLASYVVDLVLTGSAALTGTGNTLADTLVANSGADTLVAGTGVATLVGGAGNDLFVVNSASDVVSVGASHGADTVQSSASYTMPANVQYLKLTGASALTATAGGSGTTGLIVGNTGADTLNGGAGIAVLEAGTAGAQVLKATGNQAALVGGGAADTLTGGAYKDFYAAGAVADTITGGATSNVIAVNKGDGATVLAPTASSTNVLSLGAGIDTENLKFTKSGNNLVLSDGVSGDSITFTNWFSSTSNQTTTKLQVIEAASASYNGSGTDPLRNKPIEEFNFTSLVSQFTAAGSPANWSLSQGMPTATITSSTTADYGGDLAYYFGKNGNLTGMNLSAAQSTLTNASYATGLQTIDAWASISGGAPTLNVVDATEPDNDPDRATIQPVAGGPTRARAQSLRGLPETSGSYVTPAALRAIDPAALAPASSPHVSELAAAWTALHASLDWAHLASASSGGMEIPATGQLADFSALLGASTADLDVSRTHTRGQQGRAHAPL